MSLPSDALSVVLQPKASPALVTEYMPGGDGAQVINTAASGTLWLGTSSAVGPNNGVPVDAGASVQWTQAGQLWAVLDQAATDPITLLVTDRISSWTPSPEAVAAATAAELAEQGIPNVLTGELLYSGNITAMPALDVSKYASLAVHIESGGSATVCTYAFSAATSAGAVTVDAGTLSIVDGLPGASWHIPVTGPTFAISPVVAAGTITVYGSNRTVPRFGIAPPSPSKIYTFTGTDPVHNTGYTLYDPNFNRASIFDGPVSLAIVVNNTGAGKVEDGVLRFNWRDGSGALRQTQLLYADDPRLVTRQTTELVGTVPWNHPAAAGSWDWFYEGTLTTTLTVQLLITAAG